MKMEIKPRQKRGMCFVCGRQTNLPVHKGCGEKLEASRTPGFKKSVTDNSAKNYRNGALPDWMLK